MLKRTRKKFLFIFISSVALIAVGLIAAFLWFVVFHPGDEILQSNIEKILAMESPVYYRDGQNAIGVFFEEAHRQYVPYEQIPRAFIDAIVSAEDNTFFEHWGVDLGGMMRALMANIRAGKVVQGGSTITQQTAKNLFKRKDRSLWAKIKELLSAWRLEYHYSKEKILEFYSNQFFVSGNGRGLGVAAKYYFDKPVSELNALECAFIAGSVKRPNYYNPFIKNREADAEAARVRAKNRVAYVLKQMYRLGKLDRANYENFIEEEIPFQQGQMYYSINTIMDLVKEAMAKPEIEEALSRRGIDNIATSGIRVITSIEKDLQESGLLALRQELSRLDIRLKGYERADVQNTCAQLPFVSGRNLNVGDFLVGIVQSKEMHPEPLITVRFDKQDQDSDAAGFIDARGINNILNPLMKYKKNLWTRATSEDFPVLLDQIEEGDLVYVSVRKIDPDTGKYTFDLEKYPEIQGALLALNNGSIRAMIGGMENRFYNRAVMSKRSMGSIIKPLVYTTALQLGWSSLDILNNERNVFVYQGESYSPRPDHLSSYKGVSMSWAGVHSENVATVWLLYHLCDHLSPAQFKDVVNNLGLGRKLNESYPAYRNRLRDKHGIVVNNDALYRVAFANAIADLEPDLIFAGRIEEYELLKTLHYGSDFERFMRENLRDILLAREAGDKTLLKEYDVRRSLLDKNFLRYKKILAELERLRSGETEIIESLSAWEDGPFIFADWDNAEVDFKPGEKSVALEEDQLPELEPEVYELFYNNNTGLFYFGVKPEGEAWRAQTAQDLENIQAFLSEEEKADFWNSIQIEGLLAAATIKALDEVIEKEFAKLKDLPEYGEEILHSVNDFRVLVALQYLIGFCRLAGIESDLDPVLSFPLGSNVVSVLEVARVYESLSTGRIFLNGWTSTGDFLSVIDRIEDADGEVIYAPRQSSRRIIAPETSIAVTDILRNVVKYGTGRYAYKNIKLRSRDKELDAQLKELDLHVPVIGKTGTANRFTNAAFAGVVPVAVPGNKFSLDGGYVLACYVGFDDNKPMVKNSTSITGASGALPMWSRLANTIVLSKDFASSMDIVDFSFSGITEVPLYYPDLGQVMVDINSKRGWGGIDEESGTVSPAMTASITTFATPLGGGRVKPERFYQPYWQMKEN
ncbi:MAG: transglycosylase domain-containing protein [Proteobacteria bacterium]|nr:transglycosylase domain-containing protein [Pseudomonadota bacterium]MBU1708911.1 transglycosylase domain-containing protein [Pseudomonadota bacterium]